ncbi:hypothetical protein [Pseudonocardia sp.]|uniref:hypothetical protein n=1 Tax=Pseudonocardia sp. TaxID=60912 RepID=UPI003D118500
MTTRGRRLGRPRSGARYGPREVAVLADGPWAPRRYWRADLEAMQQASRAIGYPDDHPSAVLRRYQPTDEHLPDDGPAGAPARLWRCQPPTSASSAVAVPRQRGRAHAPDDARGRDRPTRRRHDDPPEHTPTATTDADPGEYVRSLW